jgi:uncharacterized protein YidB (DUF937 family)
MARATPSLTALLGLIAVAGYQHRDKIAEMLSGTTADAGHGERRGSSAGAGNLGGLLTSAAGAGGVGGLLTAVIKELLDRFGTSGERETAESWVGHQPNRHCSAESLRRALGPETLADLRTHTGLSEEELVARLCRNLPDAVDKYTPEGRIT